jgi:hypothetical protein
MGIMQLSMSCIVSTVIVSTVIVSTVIVSTVADVYHRHSDIKRVQLGRYQLLKY